MKVAQGKTHGTSKTKQSESCLRTKDRVKNAFYVVQNSVLLLVFISQSWFMIHDN